MTATRAVDMAALEGFTQLLRDCEHTVKVFIISRIEMKRQRLKAAEYIFKQFQKTKKIDKDAVFDRDVVEISDIKDNERYYGGFLFVPSVAERYCKKGRRTTAADAAHRDGVGPLSYGTTFEVVTYDTNHHLLPLLFAHLIGAECYETWNTVFEECINIPGYDIAERTTIVDQEKRIDKAYEEVFSEAKIFLDPLHVRKNMGAKLGATKAVGISLYERALYAPTCAAVDEIVLQYSRQQRAYLSKFEKSDLYKAYYVLEDIILTSQGAETQMGASLRNHIRSVEPQKMLQKVVEIQRSGFLKRKAACKASLSGYDPNDRRVVWNGSNGYQLDARCS
ncbi:unnamed protein product [Agarophyton chilense]